MTTDKWQRKVDALIRLAEDQKGKPEGDLAEEMLAKILRNHPATVGRSSPSPRPRSRTYRTTSSATSFDAMNRELADMYNQMVGGSFRFSEGFFNED